MPSDRDTLATIQQAQVEQPALYAQYRELCWKRVVQIAEQATDRRAALRACAMVLNRTDPEPRPVMQVETHGPLFLTWVQSSSPTSPAHSRKSSIESSSLDALAPLSSSSTDVLENL